TTLRVDKGWVTEASVEDVKLLPGVRRTMFRLQGGEWVAREIVKDVKTGRARFILNTGDMVWWGKQGPTPSENPYWRLVYEDVLKATAGPGRTDARCRPAWSCFPRRRQSRSVGRLRRPGPVAGFSIPEAVRSFRQEAHL